MAHSPAGRAATAAETTLDLRRRLDGAGLDAREHATWWRIPCAGGWLWSQSEITGDNVERIEVFKVFA